MKGQPPWSSSQTGQRAKVNNVNIRRMGQSSSQATSLHFTSIGTQHSGGTSM